MCMENLKTDLFMGGGQSCFIIGPGAETERKTLITFWVLRPSESEGPGESDLFGHNYRPSKSSLTLGYRKKEINKEINSLDWPYLQ